MTESISKKTVVHFNLKNATLIKENTALRKAKKLAEQECEIQTLFYNFSTSSCFKIDLKGKFLQINLSGEKLLGQNFSELINANFNDLIKIECRADFKEFLAISKAKKTKQNCKIKLIINKESPSFVSINCLYVRKAKCYILSIINISQKKHFKSKLRESDFFHKETQRLGQIGSCVLNLTTNVWENCDMINVVFGLKPNEVLSLDMWLKLIHPEDRNEMELYFNEKIKDKSLSDIEYRIIRQSDGMVRWMNGRGEFNYNIKSKETILLIVIQDVTERKLAIEKIKIAEIRSNSIFKSSKEGILILDGITGQITDANPFLIELLGFGYEELVGKELWEIGTFKNIAASKDAFKELQHKEFIRFENMPLETKAGKSIEVEFVSNVFMVDQIKVIQCHIRDISSRKKIDQALLASSQLYFAMFEKNQAVQLLIDPSDGKIIDANLAAARFYGYSLKHFKSMNLSDISDFPEQELVAELSKFGQQGQSNFQFIHKLASGETCDIEIYTSLLLIGNQRLLIATIYDITKRKLEEERLMQLNHQLKEVDALKSQFISTVSHEFRTPLAGILSSVQLLKIYSDIWDKEKKEKLYKQIFDAVHHTKSLLDDVALIDEQQNSKSFFRPRNIKLIPLINEIIEENLAISGTKHNVILKNNLAAATFYMDPIMIRHILNNLLSNAIKYSPETMDIIINVSENNNNQIKLTVEDCGIGIPKIEVKYLLEPFFRASNIGTIKGTGFGMSIVKRFVALHGGQIFIESVIDKGTKVTVILPFNR